MTPPYVLFLLKTAPYSGASAQEGMDALLAFAAFDQPIKVLFIHDGVLQLITQQNPVNSKSIIKMINAFEMYDVEEVFIHQESVLSRNLSTSQICSSHTLASSRTATDLINSASQVFSF